MKTIFSLSAFFVGILCAQAQMPQHQTLKLERTATVLLKEAPDDYMATVVASEAPIPDGNSDKAKLAQIKQASALLFPRKNGKVNDKSGAPVPQILNGFDVHLNSGIPPDNYLAVSDSNRLASVINSSIYIYKTDSGSLVSSKSLGAFTSGVGLTGINSGRFDPKIIFDPTANRFIAVVLSGINQYSNFILAFSQTADPSGLWNLYRFSGNPFNDSTWYDYPAISITENEFFLTGNQLRYNSSWQTGFKQSIIYQVNKASGYNGDSLVFNLWSDINYVGRPIRNLHPVKGGSEIVGPEQIFLSNRNFAIQNDSIFVLKIHGEIGTPACSLSVTHAVTDVPYGAAPAGRQKGSTKTLATNDGRVLGAFVEGDEIQFVSNTVDTVNGNAGVYHGKITGVQSANYTVEGYIISVDSLDFGYPNITYIEPGNGGKASIISFNHSGPNRFPGFSALYYDGSEYSDIIPVKEGLTHIDRLSQQEQRWGDYSGSQRLWSVPGVVWVEGIYGKANGYGNYAAGLGSFNAPVLEVQTPAQHILKLFPNPAEFWLNMEFTLPQAGPVAFVLTDLQGREVDLILEKSCQQGKNLLTFNASRLAAGTYFVALKQNGKILETQKFIKP
ncbi:MAG: T9SS type A sorting domain-containing protein [Flavobacteriales bacterium]|nr:T9SS type A sorting domain-containing protein [Flavobacteriales bacterium]